MNKKMIKPAQFDVPLYGLILAGGHSVRMEREKGGLVYGQRPQVQRMFDLLFTYCASTYVSVRKDQKERSWCRDLPQIHDLYHKLGPISGVLSAMVTHPGAAWFVLACDMPFVNRTILRTLIDNRLPHRDATVFEQEDKSVFEPVCAIYEPSFKQCIHNHLESGQTGLQEMIRNSDVRTIKVPDHKILASIDTPAERTLTHRQFQRGYDV